MPQYLVVSSDIPWREDFAEDRTDVVLQNRTVHELAISFDIWLGYRAVLLYSSLKRMTVVESYLQFAHVYAVLILVTGSIVT